MIKSIFINCFGKKTLSILLIMGVFCACSSEEKKTAIPDSSLRLITHNVWIGFTMVPDQKSQWTEWMQQKKPDVVSLQELNEYTSEKLKADAKSWGHPYSVLLKTEGFPTGITSRYPIKDVQRTLEGFHHGLLRVQINGIYFYVIHLHPSNWEFRMQEVNLILEDIRGLPSNATIVLAGDFNALSRTDSMYYSNGDLEKFFQQRDKEINEHNLKHGKLDYTVIDKIIENGFTDTEFSLRSQEYHFTGTFPTSVEKPGDHGAFRRLDYVFVNKMLIDHVASAKIVANDKTLLFSDHLPVIVDFRFE